MRDIDRFLESYHKLLVENIVMQKIVTEVYYKIYGPRFESWETEVYQLLDDFVDQDYLAELRDLRKD